MLTVSLTPQQMKITHSAVRLLLNDLQRGQAPEREILRGILEKLPDEHTMRAIELLAPPRPPPRGTPAEPSARLGLHPDRAARALLAQMPQPLQ